MILLAPLQGYTDFIFRNVYNRHYNGIDIAVSPFISLTQRKSNTLSTAKDVLPANNHGMPVIPQLMGSNPEQFIRFARILSDWGYDTLNWNLGCPIKHIARKKRGSGLLPYPELVRDILEKIIPNIPQRLSIKLRLGLNNVNEIYQIIPVLNDFTLENIIIHPRIGTQMYEGEVHHDILQNCLPLFKHEIIYNGDIFTVNDFQIIQNKYPTIQKWMIGRGVLLNPLLPATIKQHQLLSPEKSKEIYSSFIFDLYSEMLIFLPENSMIDKAKDMWKFFSRRFLESEKVLSEITHAHSKEEILLITRKIIAEEIMND
ncbi:MAG: tRNA-dihydrouridine synthase family protein [Bacteroidales bacterium]|jgi:tRNA-dihydrouridine synthase